MVYITSEGTVSDTKKRKWGLSLLRDWIVAVFDFIGIFFRTLTTSQAALEHERVSVGEKGYFCVYFLHGEIIV